MSTHAVVFTKNVNGTFTGTEITSDGYIEIVSPNRLNRPNTFGAGWLLAQYWHDRDEIEKLTKGNAVHTLGQGINSTDFYNWRQHGLDNLTFNDIKNLGYSYIYIFNDNNEWIVLKQNSKHKNTCLGLNCFIDYNDPERFFDHEDFWN